MTMQQERSGARRTRLTVDVTPELRRRIKIAAAKREASVRDYVVGILEEAVPKEVEERRAKGTPVTAELVERLRKTREAVMQGRTFPDDSADLLREAREERDAELDQASHS